MTTLAVSTGDCISGSRLLLALLLWVVGAAVVGFATRAIIGVAAPELINELGRWVPWVVLEVYAGLILALRVVFGAGWRAALAWHPFRTRDIAVAAASCAGAYAVALGVEGMVSSQLVGSTLAILEAIGSDGGRLAAAGPLLTAIILVRAVGLAALGEELLFRGALYAWFRKRLPAGVTIGLTAVLWAAIHGFPAIWPLALCLGLGIGWVRERSGSVLPGVLIHAGHNALMIAIAYVSSGWMAKLPAFGAS